VCVDAVGHDATVLDVLVVGVVGAGDLELVVVEQLRGGVDIIEVLGEIVADGSHDFQVVLPASDVLESGGDLAHVAIVLGCTGDQCYCPAEVESQNALHHHYLYTTHTTTTYHNPCTHPQIPMCIHSWESDKCVVGSAVN
jgi:hypothetical protein